MTEPEEKCWIEPYSDAFTLVAEVYQKLWRVLPTERMKPIANWFEARADSEAYLRYLIREGKIQSFSPRSSKVHSMDDLRRMLAELRQWAEKAAPELLHHVVEAGDEFMVQDTLARLLTPDVAPDPLTTGSRNVAIGYQAGMSVTTGANNTLIGASAMRAAMTKVKKV